MTIYFDPYNYLLHWKKGIFHKTVHSTRSLKFSPLISLSWKVFIKRKSLHFEMKLQARTLINSGVLAWSEPPHHNSKSVHMKFPHIDSSHWKPNKSTIVLENGALTLAPLHQYLWNLISEIIVLLHNRQITYFIFAISQKALACCHSNNVWRELGFCSRKPNFFFFFKSH